MNYQKDFWEHKRILKRRAPVYPVIEAFAMPKVSRIVEVIQQQESHVKTEKQSLLDVGSGNGYFSYYLNQYFDVTSLDFSHTILTVCPLKKKVQASAKSMPFKDSSFDIVFCANLLHHVEKPLVVVDEMIRVSSRYLIIIEPNRYNPFMLFLSLVYRPDRSIINFSSKYLLSLVKGKTNILLMETTGFILPNVTPRFLLPVLEKIEPFMFPKIYHMLITEKNDA